MACPYFYPVARFESNPWSVSPRLPLGDAFSGECRVPGNRVQPDETRMRETCNVGYGRHTCEHFPANSSADAIRFHIANDAGSLIQIQYIFEKDCWPRQRGVLDWTAERQFATALADENLRRQAEVFIANYLRRRSAA